MKRFFFIVLILGLLLASCSHEKRVSKASNKIYKLTKKFPQLIELKDSTLLYRDTIITSSSRIDTSFYDSLIINLKDSLVITDSLNVLTIYRKDKGLLGFTSECKTDTIYREKNIGFQFPTIQAISNCKEEIKQETKAIRKKNRQLKMALALILLAIGGFVGFRIAKFTKTGGLF